MKRFLALLIACLALALVGAGCGGDDDDDSGDGGGGGGSAQTTTEEQQPADSGSSGGTGAAAEVTMKGIKFNPADVTIKPGETVTWSNADTVGHDVTGDGFKSGSPGDLSNGDTFEHTFKKAGTYDYVCTVHPGMKGTVTVK
jgi:plastocyanin